MDVPHEYNGNLPFSRSINECVVQKSFWRSFRTTDESTNDDEAGANDSIQDGKEDDETEVTGGHDNLIHLVMVVKMLALVSQQVQMLQLLVNKEKDSHVMRIKQFSGFLKQFLKNNDTPLPVLTELLHNVSVLYARELIWLHQIQSVEQLKCERFIKIFWHLAH